MKEKRLQQLENYIKSYHMCTYEELMDHFGVSKSTIRRDVGELCRLGSVRKTYGGVTFADAETDDREEEGRLFKFESMKDAIAAEASQMVEDEDIIILGSGSTVAHMVHHLKNKNNLTIITNNFMVIQEAMNYDFNVISVGGNLYRHTMSFVGTATVKMLRELNANKAFVSCNGITQANGFSNVADLECDIKKVILNISSKTIVLADHRKFDTLSLYTYANFGDVDTVITDQKPPKEYIDLFKNISTDLRIVES